MQRHLVAIGPAEPLVSAHRVPVRTRPHRRRGLRRIWAPSTSTGKPRRIAELPPRETPFPSRHVDRRERPGAASEGSPPRESASNKTPRRQRPRTGAIRQRRTRAPSSGPMRPKCSASVVTTSSSGPEREPESTTTCTPCVVDVRQRERAPGARRSPAAMSPRTRSRRARASPRIRLPAAALLALRRAHSATAASVVPASGPNVPPRSICADRRARGTVRAARASSFDVESSTGA